MKAWERSEKSIEGACSVANITHLHWLREVELYWPWQELVWDGNRLKSRNLLRQVPWDLMWLFHCCSLKWNSFSSFVPMNLTDCLSAQRLYIFI